LQPLLLRNGLVIDTEPTPTAHPGWDVLVEDGRIAAVGPNLSSPAGATVLDASDRIVLPGFVDTHRHVWQCLLRSIAVDAELSDYFTLVRRQLGPRFRPEDVQVGNLLGALECLDAGITTVQDFAYARADRAHGDDAQDQGAGTDVEYAEASLDGLRKAGIRALIGFLLTPKEPDGVRRSIALVGRDDPLLNPAASTLGPSNQPLEAVAADWELADELSVPIVAHVASGPVNKRPIEMLRDNGLIRPDTVYIHGNSLADDELTMIADSGGAVSIAPAVEARLGHGEPMLGRLRTAGVTTGLCVDVTTSVAGDLFSVMRAALLTSQVTPSPHFTPADMLRIATLDGASALGLADQVGSLRVGKQADIVLLRADDLNLTGAHDPIGAVVSAAHPGNVDTVLVAGRVVKQDGKLLHHDLSAVRSQAKASTEYVTERAKVSA
jgi:5-methylthioadenosine/S-adenosylhomocysteine deaminase